MGILISCTILLMVQYEYKILYSFSCTEEHTCIFTIILECKFSLLLPSYLTLLPLFRFAAGIAVFIQEYPRVFSQSLHNPLCFLLYEDVEKPPSEWTDVSTQFFNHTLVNVQLPLYTLTLLRCCSHSCSICRLLQSLD